MAESTQHKLDRIRKPRVHITYDVETEGAMEEKELPFVVGVIGDFSGNPTQPLKPLRDRKFIQIDRDNFNEVMARMTPGATFRVENTLKKDGSELAVQLKFNSMDDFEPANVVQQVEPLRKLLETRNRLRDLLAKVDLSPELEQTLEEILENTDQLQRLSTEQGMGASESTPEPSGPEASGGPDESGGPEASGGSEEPGGSEESSSPEKEDDQ
jgi:type VI secretion system protein ImpB